MLYHEKIVNLSSSLFVKKLYAPLNLFLFLTGDEISSLFFRINELSYMPTNRKVCGKIFTILFIRFINPLNSSCTPSSLQSAVLNNAQKSVIPSMGLKMITIRKFTPSEITCWRSPGACGGWCSGRSGGSAR